jgi:hypothetical protein
MYLNKILVPLPKQIKMNNNVSISSYLGYESKGNESLRYQKGCTFLGSN